MNGRSRRSSLGRLAPAAFLAATLACGGSPVNPEAGMSLPKDPGTVNATVVDQSAAPVAQAWVSVEMPSNLGNLFRVSSPTRADGTVSFAGIPAGRRRVELAVPAGFSAGATPLVQEVDVVKDRVTAVSFDLVRK